jgi:molecular chaperone GrpE
MSNFGVAEERMTDENDAVKSTESDVEIQLTQSENQETQTQEDQIGQDETSGVDESGSIIEALQQELAETKEQFLRAQAEMNNVRRRAEMDVEKAHKYGVEKLVRELLPVVDGLEKTIETFDGSDTALSTMREGVEMTLSLLMKGLEKHQVEQLDPHGEPFDPAHHEAMSMVDVPGTEPNSVINVVQKGYKLHGRLVRPAMVVVSKSTPKIDENA